MNDQIQNVSLPAYLLKRLQAYRIGKGIKQSYLIRDKLLGRTYDFEPWQFFVLEILPGCESFEKLASIFKDRFGYPITHEQVRTLFASVMEDNLLDIEDKEASAHPLLASFFQTGKIADQPSAAHKAEQPSIDNSQSESIDQESEDLPAGIQDSIDLDSRVVKRMWKLFDPRPVLKLITPVLVPVKYCAYLLPILVAAAIMLIIKYQYIINQDMNRLLADTTFFHYIVFSMFSVNLIVVITKAVVAHNFRVTVSAFGIGLFLGFLPRFTLQTSHLHQLSRRERILLHAAPLMVRLSLFSLGVLIWYYSRSSDSHLPQMGLMLTVICTFGFLFSANPLLKSDGYHLLSAFMNEPFLRGKSYQTLLNKLYGTSYKESDNNLLIAYALAICVFLFLLIIGVVVFVGAYLQQIQLGGSSIILVTLLGLYLFRLVFSQFGKINEAYERSVQYGRWRNRVLPEESPEKELEKKESAGFSSYVKRALFLSLLASLFLPYPYEPSGKFIIFPSQKQMIATDIPGIIEQVYFDGGETVEKGTVLARLANKDLQSQVKIYAAKIDEQQAVIEELKSRPKREEVKLAQNLLNIEITRAKFSGAKLQRIKNLYKQSAVSFEELDSVEREHHVNLNQIDEKRAALELLKSGATKNQIDAAQAKLASLIEERDAYIDRVSRSELSMPFDGNILTLHLKQKINSFLEKGELFAEVENATQVTAEIEIPESDIAHITNTARVRVKPASYHSTPFYGTVTTIDRGITTQPYGNVVRVIALIENENGELRTGMTGFAKIEAETIPVWKAFSLSILRFINVEAWSWVP